MQNGLNEKDKYVKDIDKFGKEVEKYNQCRSISNRRDEKYWLQEEQPRRLRCCKQIRRFLVQITLDAWLDLETQPCHKVSSELRVEH